MTNNIMDSTMFINCHGVQNIDEENGSLDSKDFSNDSAINCQLLYTK